MSSSRPRTRPSHAPQASGESLLWALASGTRSTLASGARKAVPHSADELLEFLCGDDQLYDAGACGCKVAEKEHASAAITVLPGDAKAEVACCRQRR